MRKCNAVVTVDQSVERPKKRSLAEGATLKWVRIPAKAKEKGGRKNNPSRNICWENMEINARLEICSKNVKKKKFIEIFLFIRIFFFRSDSVAELPFWADLVC